MANIVLVIATMCSNEYFPRECQLFMVRCVDREIEGSMVSLSDKALWNCTKMMYNAHAGDDK